MIKAAILLLAGGLFGGAIGKTIAPNGTLSNRGDIGIYGYRHYKLYEILF